MDSEPARCGGGRALRLLTISHFFPDHGGGIELVARRLIDGFAARGAQIDWLASDTGVPPPSSASVRCTAVPSLHLIERLTQLSYPLWSPQAVRMLWRAMSRCDIVHIHEHLYCGSILALVLARLRRRPVVVTQHVGALVFSSATLTFFYAKLTRLMARILFRYAACTVFISEGVRRFFPGGSASRRSGTRSALIFNGVDTSRFRDCSAQESAALRQSLGFSPDRKLVLFIGRFVRRKGLHIIEALTRLFADVDWVLIGSGPEDPHAWQRPNVHAPGRIPHEELSAYYQSADLLVLPSTGEGLPLVVQEALCCGLGVLSTHEVAMACPEASRLIRTPAEQSDAISVTRWADALRSALIDSRYLDARATRSLKARELWSWDRCVSDYLQIFDELHADQFPDPALRVSRS